MTTAEKGRQESKRQETTRFSVTDPVVRRRAGYHASLFFHLFLHVHFWSSVVGSGMVGGMV